MDNLSTPLIFTTSSSEAAGEMYSTETVQESPLPVFFFSFCGGGGGYIQSPANPPWGGGYLFMTLGDLPRMGIRRGGSRTSPRRGRLPNILVVFPMKLKKFWSVGGVLPLNPPLIWVFQPWVKAKWGYTPPPPQVKAGWSTLLTDRRL